MERLYTTLSEIVDQELPAEQLECYFVKVAKLLLLQSKLRAGNKSYQLLEIEFYFHAGEFHPDPYSHFSQYPNSVKQKQSIIGSWYFHRFTGMKNYTHTRRGVDLTFGNGDENRYGGILIRTIKEMDGVKVISGPSRVVAELIDAVDHPEHLERIAFDTERQLAFDNQSMLHLEALMPPLTADLYRSKRFGLGDKNLEYREKAYRFFTDLSAIRRSKDFQYVRVSQ